MRNDKERKAFVEDDRNWKTAGQYTGYHPGGVRISRLQYGGESWYKVEVMSEYNSFSYTEHKTKAERGWHTLRMYAPTADYEVFGESVSVTQIVNAIKEIDMGRR